MKRALAALFLLIASTGIVRGDTIAQWNFQTVSGEPPVATGTTDTSIGSGTISTVGGLSHVGFNSGTGSTDTIVPNLGYQTTDFFPAQSTASATAGIQVAVDTTGYSNIVCSFDLRTSNTSSRWYQIQYSTNGIDFSNFGAPVRMERFDEFFNDIGVGDFWNNNRSVDFSSLPAVNNNPSFAFRVVSVFSPVAFTQYNGSINYGADEAYEVSRNRNFTPNSVYAATGTWRFDMVTVSGDEISAGASIVNGFVYYREWGGAGDSIDTSKQLFKQTDTPTSLDFAHLINAAQGITGIGFDFQGLGNPGAVSGSDFEVRVSPTGIFDEGLNPAGAWELGPAPSVSVTSLAEVDRVQLEWNNTDSAKNRWLRITVKANANTGLVEDETYYVGHLLGETTGLSGGNYTVAFADITTIRNSIGQTVSAESTADIDKSGIVAFADISAMRSNVGAQLTNITVP